MTGGEGVRREKGAVGEELETGQRDRIKRSR